MLSFAKHSTREFTLTPYVDRYGKHHQPTADARIRERTGVFGIVHNNAGKLLLTYPSFDLCQPQLPGGGVEAGESLEAALLREINEEVGKARNLQTELIAERRIHYYADDKDEFWLYQQYYFRVTKLDISVPAFGRWRSPEGSQAGWRTFNKVTRMHDVHKEVVTQLE